MSKILRDSIEQIAFNRCLLAFATLLMVTSTLAFTTTDVNSHEHNQLLRLRGGDGLVRGGWKTKSEPSDTLPQNTIADSSVRKFEPLPEYKDSNMQMYNYYNDSKPLTKN